MSKRLETLNKLAQQLPKVENNTSLKTYFNSSQNLYNQAEIFQHDGDLEKAYIFYMRFAVFVTERIPKHKSYASGEFEELRTQIRAKCATALDELATIKGELVKLYKQIEAEEERKRQLEEAKRREAEELKARLQREKEEAELAKAKKEESSDDDLMDYLNEDHSAYHNDNAPIIIDKEQDELLSKFKRLQPAINSNNGNPAEKSAPSSGLSSLINSNNTNANNGLDVDALASATWSTNSLMEGIIYDAKNSNKKEDNGVNLSLEDYTNSILFRPSEPEQLIIEAVKIPTSDPPHEHNIVDGHNEHNNSEVNVQLLNEELMVQQLAMFDKQIYSGKVTPVTKPSEQPMEFLPQSFDSTVVDVFAHVNNGNEKRDKSPPKASTQANGDSMMAVRPKKEMVKDNKQEKLGPPPSYDSLVKIVEEKKQEQKAAVTTPVPAPVKSVTPATVKTPTVNPLTPVNQQAKPVVQNHVAPQPVAAIKDKKEQLLAAAKAKADSQQLELMLAAQPSAPPMEDTNKNNEVFSDLKNFIEESKSAPKSIPSALTEVKNDKFGNNLSNLVKDNNPSLYNFPRVEESAMPVLPKVVENKDKKEKKPKSKDKHRTKSPRSSNDTSNAVPKEIQMQLEQQKQQIELLQLQVTEQQRLQQQYVQYYQLMQQLYGVQQHPHDHSGHDHSHSHGSNGNKNSKESGTSTPKVAASPVTAPKQASLPLPQALPQPQSKTVSSPNQSASRMQPLPPPATKLPGTASNQLVPQHAPLPMPQTGQSPQQLQQLQQQLQQAQSPFPVIYGVPVVFRPYNLNLPTATNAVKTLGLNKQQQLQYQEQQFQNIYQTNKTGGILPNLQITADAPIKEPAKPKQPEKIPEIIKKKPAKLIGGLRPMEVDGELFNSFMDHAESNTSRSVETCGILCGVLDEINEVFQVTCLMIPKQVGTSDTCATTDEEEIFDFQMKNDLLTLGWIHTHPTQSCFLSSVDLHTQCSYQSLFPEAIAVVIAPKFNPNFNIFNLTDRGLGFVQRCPRSGFHYHEESDLYNTSDHVKIRWGKKKYKVVDMRKKSYVR